MSEFDTTANDAETETTEDEREPLKDRASYYFKYVMRRLVALLSFGPGILGVLWLLGRILKR